LVWDSSVVERHTINMEEEVHRFSKNGDQTTKPGYFFLAAEAPGVGGQIPYTLCGLT
jgi:hypothetical protein